MHPSPFWSFVRCHKLGRVQLRDLTESMIQLVRWWSHGEDGVFTRHSWTSFMFGCWGSHFWLRYEWYLVYLSLKALHVFYRTSNFILFPWSNFTFREPHSSDPSSCSTFDHLLFNMFLPVDATMTSDGSFMICSGVTVAHNTVLILIKERHFYTIKIICVEIDEDHLSHLFLWNIHRSPFTRRNTFPFFFNTYHENVLNWWDLYRGIWQAFQGCQR